MKLGNRKREIQDNGIEINKRKEKRLNKGNIPSEMLDEINNFDRKDR